MADLPFPTEFVAESLNNGVFEAILAPASGYAIESTSPAIVDAFWLAQVDYTDGTSTEYQEEDPLPAWLLDLSLVAVADGPGGEKRYNPKVTIDEASWDLVSPESVWVGARITNPSSTEWVFPYLPSGILWQEATSYIVGADATPGDVVWEPNPAAAFFWRSELNPVPIEDPSNIITQGMLQGSIPSNYQMRCAGGRQWVTDAPGVFNGKPFLRVVGGGFNSVHLQYKSFNGAYGFTEGPAYDAFIISYENDGQGKYGYYTGSNTTNEINGYQHAFNPTNITDSWTGAELAPNDVTQFTPHLIENIFHGNGTFSVYVDGVFAMIRSAVGNPYTPCLVPRYAATIRIGMRYCLESLPTDADRAGIKALAAEYGVLFDVASERFDSDASTGAGYNMVEMRVRVNSPQTLKALQMRHRGYGNVGTITVHGSVYPSTNNLLASTSFNDSSNQWGAPCMLDEPLELVPGVDYFMRTLYTATNTSQRYAANTANVNSTPNGVFTVYDTYFDGLGVYPEHVVLGFLIDS